MIKRTGMIAIAIIFTGTLVTSCSRSHNLCPAYTMNYKLKKIETFKTTISDNQQAVFKNY